MNIFVDESGTFSGSAAQQRSVSVVGALIVPDRNLVAVERKYAALRTGLPTEKGEVKGRRLTEHEVDSVVSMLVRHEVIFEATAIDLSAHQDSDISDHKMRQAESITKRVTERYNPSLRDQLFDLRHRLENLPNQLYVQSVAMTSLIITVIRNAPTFYSQRIPKELAAFHWVIDGKGHGQQITDWENWWSLVLKPMIQSRTLQQPLAMITGAGFDYSYFGRFDAHESTPRQRPRRIPGIGAHATDLRKLLDESFRFSSDPEPGLEMVDILTNATRRALMGTLKASGWRNIPRLMIRRPRHYIDMVAFRPDRRTVWPYAEVLSQFGQSGRDMLAPRLRRQREAHER